MPVRNDIRQKSMFGSRNLKFSKNICFVPTYRSARYLFVFYPQAGIIGKTILAIVKLQKLLGTTETE